MPLEALDSDDNSLALAFDRAWAAALLREAGERHLEAARARGQDAVRRHRLLRLRFADDLPIREIARRWDVEAAWLHGPFRQAREEFRRALEDVVREHQEGGPESVDRECSRLLEHSLR